MTEIKNKGMSRRAFFGLGATAAVAAGAAGLAGCAPAAETKGAGTGDTPVSATGDAT